MRSSVKFLVYSIACPRCGSNIGYSCKSPEGNFRIYPHRDRTWAIQDELGVSRTTYIVDDESPEYKRHESAALTETPPASQDETREELIERLRKMLAKSAGSSP